MFEMNLVLNGVPAELQAFAKIAFVDRVASAKGQEAALIIQILNDARNGLARLNIAESEKYPWYFGVLPLTLKYQPAEASTAFKDAVASLNRAEVSKKDQANPLNTTELSKVLPASLLEIDEFAVKEGLASVVSVETRAQLRLELLNATLQRMRKAQATVGSKDKQE